MSCRVGLRLSGCVPRVRVSEGSSQKVSFSEGVSIGVPLQKVCLVLWECLVASFEKVKPSSNSYLLGQSYNISLYLFKTQMRCASNFCLQTRFPDSPLSPHSVSGVPAGHLEPSKLRACHIPVAGEDM